MPETRILVIGGVAGGATAAARLRRLSETAKITLVERGPYVSYANCGLPYFISGDIQKRSQLLLQTPEGFQGRYGVEVKLQTEALKIDRTDKKVLVRGPAGEEWLAYDKLLLAQGGNPILPPLPGSDAELAFKLWTVPDMDRIQAFIAEKQPKTAIVAGGGFIGLEMAEAFHARGIHTTVVELAPRLMSVLDPEFGNLIKTRLTTAGLGVETGVGLKAVLADSHQVELSDGRKLPADLVLFSVGVRPELTLAKDAGLTIGNAGGLLVDDNLRTSDPDIFAAGDMTEIVHKIAGKKVRVPLAGPANRQGRIAATNLLGGKMRYNGALGTSVVKILDFTAAATGLTEKAAREAGFDVGAAWVHKDHHAGYYPGAKELSLKIVYDRKTGRLLGGQAWGQEGVDKRIDVLATALHGKMTLDDLAEIDLAYAPPYSSANDPVNMVSFVGLNDLSGFSPIITPAEFKARFNPATDLVIDVRNRGEYAKGHLPGSLNLPVDEIRWSLDQIPRDKNLFVHCRIGFRGHVALRILKENGFAHVWNITGGMLSLEADGGFTLEQ